MTKTNLFKQTFMGAIVALTALSSCKKEDSAAPQPPARPVLLTEFKSGDDVTKFAYHADGTFKSITLSNDPVSTDENVTYTATYAANKKIAELNGTNGSKLKLTYTNNLLSKMEAFFGTHKFAETVYEYNAAVMKSTTISVMDNDVAVPYFKSDFTFTNVGNISRTNAFMFNPTTNKLESIGHVTKQYDTNPNPLYLLGDIVAVFWQASTKNNITKQQHFNKDGNAAEVIETTYTYNPQGYPVRATMKETMPGQQPTNATITYTYQ
jgi:hypothetical protein